MAEKITIGYIDRSREFSRSQFYVATQLGDDITEPIADAQLVQAAIAVVTLCNFTDMSLHHLIESDAPTTPTSPNAQREIALWVQYVDTVDGSYQTMTIPAPDLTLLAQANTDEVDIVANVTAAALAAVLDANLVSEQGNDIEVTRMRILGRRN